MCDGNYIDPKFTAQSSDIVYQSQMLDGSTGYLYFHVEHQSAACPLMPLRMLKYQLAIIDQHLLKFSEEKKLPIVFGMLLYAGDKKPYPFTLDILDLFYDPILAERTLAKPAHLIDVTMIPDQEIIQHSIIGLLEFVIKHIKDPDLSLLTDSLGQIISNISSRFGTDRNMALYIQSNLYYIISEGNIEKSDEFIKKLDNIPLAGEIMGSLARKFIEEGEVKGEARGIVKGEAVGIVKGEAIGEEKTRQNIAIAMLKKGLDIQVVSDITCISIAELHKLKDQIENEI